jgi:hypothetical protein
MQRRRKSGNVRDLWRMVALEAEGGEEEGGIMGVGLVDGAEASRDVREEGVITKFGFVCRTKRSNAKKSNRRPSSKSTGSMKKYRSQGKSCGDAWS